MIQTVLRNAFLTYFVLSDFILYLGVFVLVLVVQEVVAHLVREVKVLLARLVDDQLDVYHDMDTQNLV